ncbi:MAG: DNA repair protein RecO [Candidatus Magasanikbacteria bacterium]|nr:DNA repair protein RecO [Candidatus Magasanikbacteria bacterium]
MLALTLQRKDFREYDQIVSLYSKEQGRLDLLARGLKKITAKHAAHLEPFSLVSIEVAPGKGIDHLIKVQPLEYFSGIRSDFKKAFVVRRVLSIFNTFVKPRDPDGVLFELLCSWLYFVNSSSTEIRVSLMDAFVLALCSRLGFRPVLDSCVICSKPFQDMIRENLSGQDRGKAFLPGFYCAGGGLVCNQCRIGKERIHEQIFVCGLKELSHLQALLKEQWALIALYDIPAKEAENIHKLVYEFAVYHQEYAIPDWASLKSGLY